MRGALAQIPPLTLLADHSFEADQKLDNAIF
jgi:hypothetical protein